MADIRLRIIIHFQVDDDAGFCFFFNGWLMDVDGIWGYTENIWNDWVDDWECVRLFDG